MEDEGPSRRCLRPAGVPDQCRDGSKQRSCHIVEGTSRSLSCGEDPIAPKPEGGYRHPGWRALAAPQHSKVRLVPARQMGAQSDRLTPCLRSASSRYGRAHVEVGGAADELGSEGIEVQPVPALEGMMAVAVVFQMMHAAHAHREAVMRLQPDPRITCGSDVRDFDRLSHAPLDDAVVPSQEGAMPRPFTARPAADAASWRLAPRRDRTILAHPPRAPTCMLHHAAASPKRARRAAYLRRSARAASLPFSPAASISAISCCPASKAAVSPSASGAVLIK